MAAPDPLKANEHMKTEYQLSVLLDKVMAGGCRLLLQLVVVWASYGSAIVRACLRGVRRICRQGWAGKQCQPCFELHCP